MKKSNQVNYIAIIAALILTCLLSFNPALAINRCTTNGKVTYTDLPCPNTAQHSEFTPPVIPPDNPVAEKKRHLANQKKPQKIEQQKPKEEQQYQRQANALAHQIKKQEEHQFKCKKLDLKRKAARRHQAAVQLKRNSYATDKARLRVKLADNKYKHYCKS